MSWFEAAVRWYAILLIISLAWAPCTLLLARRLPDRGLTIARPVGLLATVYPLWLLSSLSSVPFGSFGLWLTLGVGAIAGWTLIWRTGELTVGWLRQLAGWELLSIAAFAGFAGLRGFTPAITTTEKPMEAAFLLSSQLTVSMPPPDPWFAGEPINYYYLGYLLHGSVGRLAGVPGTTGFNFALATTFSLALVAAAGLGWNLGRAWLSRGAGIAAAALTALFVVFAGNLYASQRFATDPMATLAADWWDTANGIAWRASRIVCDGVRIRNDCPQGMTINEFPSFSFILGDLHPHLLALPFAIASLTLAFNLLLLARDRRDQPRLPAADWCRLIAIGACIGSLYALNSWDFPTYLGIALLALIWGSGGRWRWAATVAAASVIAWLPFTLTYVPPGSSVAAFLPAWLANLPIVPRILSLVGVHTEERTDLAEFLTIFGAQYSLALILLGVFAYRDRAKLARDGTSLLLGTVSLVLAGLLFSTPLLVAVGIPLLVILILVSRQPVSLATIALGLIGTAFALILMTEYFFILDAFTSRMNTLFKVYYQAWVLLGVAAAAGVVELWHAARRRAAARVGLAAAIAVVLVTTLISPILSARAWTDGFTDWQGLDGIAFVADFSTDELAAIHWLQANVRPDDVILEAAGCSYQVNSGVVIGRGATFSGAPNVIGWDGHERQWRSGQPTMIEAIPTRQTDVATMFANPGSPLLDRYGISLIYVGKFEQEDWQRVCDHAGPYQIDPTALAAAGWQSVFTQGEVTIYRRGEV